MRLIDERELFRYHYYGGSHANSILFPLLIDGIIRDNYGSGRCQLLGTSG